MGSNSVDADMNNRSTPVEAYGSGVKPKRKTYDGKHERSLSDEIIKGGKKSKEWTEEDSRLEALMIRFLDDHFDTQEKINPQIRNLLIRFGAEAFTYASSMETDNTIGKMQSEMREQFKRVNDKLDGIVSGSQPSNSLGNSGKVANYVQAVLSAPKKDTVLNKVKDSSCYSVLHPDADTRPTDDQTNEWKSALGATQRRHRIRMNKMQVTKANNLAISFDSPAEQQRFADVLRKEPIQGVQLRSSGEKMAYFAMRGVPSEYTVKDVEDELWEMNSWHPFFLAMKQQGTTLDFKDARRNENLQDTRRYKTLKLAVPMKFAKILLENSYMQLLFKRIQVTIWKPNERCAKCLGKGHFASTCDQKVVCKHCGGEHQSISCREQFNKAKHRCTVCHRAGSENFFHRADVGPCPILGKEAEENVERMVAIMLANHHG